MKFELLLIASVLSHLANYAGMVDGQTTTPNPYSITNTDNTTNHTITTNVPTIIPFLNGTQCYEAEYAFKKLDPQAVLLKMGEVTQKDKTTVLVIKPGRLSCGLSIIKNPRLNNYKFTYGFVDNNACTEKIDTICDTGANCTTTAMKCCQGSLILPCNLYGIAPNLNTTCLPANNTKSINCFQIVWGGNVPTPKNDAVATTTANYYLTVIQTAIGALFIYNIKDIN